MCWCVLLILQGATVYVSVWVWHEKSQKKGADRTCQSEHGHRQPQLEGGGTAPKIPGQSLPYTLPIVLSTAGTTVGSTAATPTFELKEYALTLPRTAVFGDVVHTLRVRDLLPHLFYAMGDKSTLCACVPGNP